MISLLGYSQENMAGGIITALFPSQAFAAVFYYGILRCTLLLYTPWVFLLSNYFQTNFQKMRCLLNGCSIQPHNGFLREEPRLHLPVQISVQA